MESRVTALDTSLLIAALQSWHSEHDRCARALNRALDHPPVIVPLHALLETYSVLTRLPRRIRLAPAQAFELLDRTLRGKAEIVEMSGGEGLRMLETLRDGDITGGAVYDAVIAESAFRAGARSLLTLNRQHFERVAPDGLEIVEPE
jgi:predicted nucleic acid-binding protein